jgi:glycosyltransferase involved in cell wall biosynthesis
MGPFRRLRKPVLTIFFHFDPWGDGIGGIHTLIRSHVKYAPDEFEVRVVGAGGASDTPGAWRIAELHGREIRFMPLYIERKIDTQARIPDTMKYAFHLAGRDLASDFMHFHRIEPTMLTWRWPGEKTLFIHLDIEKQLRTEPQRNESRWRRFPHLYLALERLLIGQFHQVLSCNSSSLRFHRERYPRLASRFRFIRNCIDTDIHYPLDPATRQDRRRMFARSMGLHADTRFVLFAGRLEPMKDPLLLLRAFAALNRASTHLLIAGAGSLQEEIRQEITRLNLHQHVSLLGGVAPDQLANLQRVSAVLLLTSAYEGLPMVLLEALACGTPVVTTPSGESADILSPGTGIVSKDFRADSIAEVLRRVLDDPEGYASPNCAQAAKPYSARAVLADLFDEMLARWATRNAAS